MSASLTVGRPGDTVAVMELERMEVGPSFTGQSIRVLAADRELAAQLARTLFPEPDVDRAAEELALLALAGA